MNYRLIEKAARVIAVDDNDIEICGARQPYGHDEWLIHTTTRLTTRNHQVIALTRDCAVAHVRMLAELFLAAHPAQRIWSPDDARELARRAAQFDAVDCSGAVAEVGETA